MNKAQEAKMIEFLTPLVKKALNEGFSAEDEIKESKLFHKMHRMIFDVQFEVSRISVGDVKTQREVLKALNKALDICNTKSIGNSKFPQNIPQGK